MLKHTIIATLVALAFPLAANVEAVEQEEYKNYQVSCNEASTCHGFDVTYEKTGDEVAQTRRTRPRRTRRTRDNQVQAFKNFYLGVGGGLLFAEDSDLGGTFNVSGGTKFTPNIGADLEFLFSFAGVEDFDETATVFGFLVNPRFEYKFNNSNLTGFVSPGIGLGIVSAFDDSETDLAFQIKAGLSAPVSEATDVYGQGRYLNIDGFDNFSVEGGAIFKFEQ